MVPVAASDVRAPATSVRGAFLGARYCKLRLVRVELRRQPIRRRVLQ